MGAAEREVAMTKDEHRMRENPIYLGDAVYAFFDGNGIELRLDDHASGCLIYLEPEVIEALKLFWGAVRQAR
jgi:hypothetical protein